ncbi:adenylate/guanylate cyclase domain-containing protein [Gordonia sinesedis]
MWGLSVPPTSADWKEFEPRERARLVRRAVVIAGVAIVGSNTLIGLETFLLVQLAYNGSQLTFDTTLGAPDFPAVIVAIVVGVLVNIVVSILLMLPQIRWFVSGQPADDRRRLSVQRIPILQVLGTVTAWSCALLVWMLLSLSTPDLTGATALGVAVAFSLAALSSSCLTYLFAERAARPLAIVALEDNPTTRPLHGVKARMVAVWAISSAVPMVGLLVMNLGRWSGLLPPVFGRIDWATVVLALIGLSAGARVVFLVGQALTDPLAELQAGVQQVQDGDYSAHVDVYDSSELGVLQHGFNDMVAGLSERERMRELFARHVGDTVAELAIEQGMGMRGTNTDVGVLFVDIVGSTALAQRENPHQVANLLNSFFEIVAEVVDEHQGFVNKFEGDAALAVFGAPVEIPNPAAAALSAARDLARVLSDSLDIRWGIGVSYGRVFAGNIGAERRYEYTVIGDPVNECARLSELAKTGRAPVLASGAAIHAAGEAEEGQWGRVGTRVLRGRSRGTEVFAPLALEWHRPLSMSGVISGLLRPAKWMGSTGTVRS